MKLVIGLGNPGRKYARTRHNIGFEVVEEAARRWLATGPKAAFGGMAYDARPTLGDGRTARVVLLQPHTFMNCSGRAVRDIAGFYKTKLDDILIVLDDLALPTGQLRLRVNGSAGGHNGLSDIIRLFGSNCVPRLRIGIGAAPEFMDTADYVLQRFGDNETETMRQAVLRASQAVEDWVFNGATRTMDIYNQRPGQDSD
ncbi:MAG: aminoacyl-tRNA hydrolase [Phycisphaerales bacterium]|nr:aminoacyl-tRNA hydrolase [Phycisphaerales bacterium]